MHISAYAQDLLDSGEFKALQALSYERLLPPAINDEIRVAFENPQEAVATGDSLPGSFIDCIHLESLKEACVVSSGQIYSRETIVSHIERQCEAGEEVVCPMSRGVLNIRLNSGLGYVLLPAIDELLNDFRKALRAPSAPPLNQMHVGTLLLKAANCKVRMVIELEPEYHSDFTGFLERRLPNSWVARGSGSSYSMGNHQAFGRCWKIRGEKTYEIDLWFPSKKKKTSSKRTFGNYHLNQLFDDFCQILNLPSTQATSNEQDLQDIANIPDKEYVVALDATPVTEEMLVACCDHFLEKTQEIAEERGWPVEDEVLHHDRHARPSVTTGSGHFVPGSAAHTTTTMRPSNR